MVDPTCEAFLRLFPYLSSRIMSYRKLHRNTIKLNMRDRVTLVFRYESDDMWQLQTYKHYANR